jgi:AcrR family transcriptional regulator
MKEKDEQNDKQSKLLKSAFKLFTEKGVKDTSIQEITSKSNVAKGTFYLYFKDKYEIRDVLIAQKSKKLFNDALKNLRKQANITTLTDQIIFIIDNIIDDFVKNPLLLKFISKNLSWGVYNETVNKIYEDNEKDENGMRNLFLREITEKDIHLKNPDVTLFMILELVSSTCFNSILYDNPLPINELKPYLHETIKLLINE